MALNNNFLVLFNFYLNCADPAPGVHPNAWLRAAARGVKHPSC